MTDPRRDLSPQDSLLSYFDELLRLTDDDLPAMAHQLAPERPALASSRPFAEPEPLPADDKIKLARLLEEARLQRLAEERAAEWAEVETETVTFATQPLTPEIPVAPVIATQPLEAPEPKLAPELTSRAVPAPVVVPELDEDDLFNDGQFETVQLEWEANGRPVWAQQRFDVLLFDVAGLTLAVPLVALGQIQLITDQLTPLFGQADWFMGLLPTPMGKLRTVNTAKFVMPERYDDSFLESAKYVVSINGLPWGLAVDKVNQPISLDPDDVKWRGERSKRPWLAGTVKQHMCVLIDIPMMGQMLQDLDANARRAVR